MDFRVLGPLEVRIDGAALSLGGPRQRALLAILLLHANRVVSRERLIEELWGVDAPETTGHALNVSVARLRKALGGEGIEPRLVSQAPGYVLYVEPGELDLARFDELVQQGRAAASTADHERAAERLRAAEALWRGRPLADLEFEPFARLEVERLEERRLCVVENRIDAELALGRHDALVAELDALAAQHPLRERLREQLMLALYRSGRQAEALAAYRDGHALLVEQQGLDPSPSLQELERAILQHDEALRPRDAPGASPVAETALDAIPSSSAPLDARAPGRRGAQALVAGLATALLAGLAAIALSPEDDRARALVGGNTLAVLSPEGRLTASAALRAPATRMTAGFGSLWLTHSDAGRVSRVEAADRTVREASIRVGGGPTGIAAGAGSVWVTNSLDGTISRIDPATEEVVQRIRIGGRPSDVVVSGGAVWVADADAGSVVRLDARSGRIVRAIDIATAPTRLAVAADSLWVTSELGRSVTRIDLHTNAVSAKIAVGGGAAGIAISGRDVWVANNLDDTVSRIDADRDTVTATIAVGSGPDAVAISGRAVWVVNEFGGALSRIDARSARVTASEPTRGEPTTLAGMSGRVWVATREHGPSHRGGRLVLLNPNREFDSIDPATAHELSPGALLGMTNDGLVTFKHVSGSDGTQLVPNLAVTLSSPTDGGLRYTFRLRRGLRYSTGQAIRASDVRHALERVFRLRSLGTVFYDAIIGAPRCAARPERCDLSQGVIVDDRRRTVAFRLRKPDPELLYKLALPFAYVVPAGTPTSPIRTRPLPATGPYRIASYQPGYELRLVRNMRFREWSRAARPDGYVDEIVWKLGITPGAAVDAILAGRADFAVLGVGAAAFAQLPPGRRADINTRHAGQLRVHDTLGTEYLAFNVRTAPFNDVRARRALNFAIDRRAIARTLYGEGAAATPTCQTLPPQIPGYRRYCPYTARPSPAGVWRAPDLARARRLVAASNTKGMDVVVLNPNTPTAGVDAARLLATTLRHIGYRPRLKLVAPEDFDRLSSNHTRARFNIVPSGWFADYPAASTFLGLHLACSARLPRSDDSPNISGFCSPRLDQAMRRARALQINSPSAANSLWARIDREIVDRAVWAPLFTPTLSDLLSRRVGNHRYHPFWGPLIDQLWVR